MNQHYPHAGLMGGGRPFEQAVLGLDKTPIRFTGKKKRSQ